MTSEERELFNIKVLHGNYQLFLASMAAKSVIVSRDEKRSAMRPVCWACHEAYKTALERFIRDTGTHKHFNLDSEEMAVSLIKLKIEEFELDETKGL